MPPPAIGTTKNQTSAGKSIPPLKSEYFGSHICAHFRDQKETDIDEQMRQNHFIHGAKQNQF